ncbi:MAG: hypothetical protein P0120_00120 [Nitrospira sp.]|nr:hypothetical protein [Nitrospira sp.]
MRSGIPTLVLTHPLKTKAIASAQIETEKIDATKLAHLLQTNLLPAAYPPPPCRRGSVDSESYSTRSLIKEARHRRISRMSQLYTATLHTGALSVRASF